MDYPPQLQKERKKKWDKENQEAISDALKQLNEFEKVYIHSDFSIGSPLLPICCF